MMRNRGFNIKSVFGMLLSLFFIEGMVAQRIETAGEVLLKSPGNPASRYELRTSSSDDGKSMKWLSDSKIPLDINGKITPTASGIVYDVELTAHEDVFFNFKQRILAESATHENCKFFMPGFWYRHNLRSPKEAPSFHTSDSWLVREDRLSAPLTGVYDEQTGQYYSILRNQEIRKAAYTAINQGEVILSGESDLGFTGFENIDGKTWLSFGFPYREAPKTYIRKLTLAPPVTTFARLRKGETRKLSWIVSRGTAADYADFVSKVWTSTYDHFLPKEVELDYTEERVKEVLSNFFVESYVETDDLNYFSGVHLKTDVCGHQGGAEIGFVGRVLLNAFFAHQYAGEQGDEQLAKITQTIFNSYLANGFTGSGFFREFVDYDRDYETDVFSIRRQSEGIYAILSYLDYEKKQGRKHPEWEKQMEKLLANFLRLQKDDGSFPRKFKDNFEVVDVTGGSTPSATVPLVMASRYFNKKEYLKSAIKSGNYLETELISRSDYFSSTLDANCEDKEASLYAATAMYYLALASNGKEHDRYVALAKNASYFALSWYYLWDVPFAQGQMLGDLGLLSRGWGNVSVENNHIDVFIFEFADVLNYLARETSESRFSEFAKVINSSMLQLLPYPGHLCGVAKTGYYPEVVQHTNWDYGKNGKGFYNDIFAPGWTVASLWEMLTPGSAEEFMKK